MQSKRRRAVIVAALAFVLLGLAPASAVANGRYPASSAFVFFTD